MNTSATKSDSVRALILAGGFGTRLHPITETTPKCLVPILGRPLLDYWFEALATAGVKHVLVNTHHLPQPVREYLDAKNHGGRHQASEAYEPELLGSAGTITANRNLADGASDVIIIYADNLSSLDISDLLRFHRSHGDPFTMLLFRAENPSACGIAELDAQGRIIDFVEKPKHPVSDLANAGVYVVSGDAFREIADMNAFDLGFEVLPRFIGRMHGYVFEGYHRDIGTLAALEAAEREALSVFALQEDAGR